MKTLTVALLTTIALTPACKKKGGEKTPPKAADAAATTQTPTAADAAAAPAAPMTAVAELKPTKGNNANGTITFTTEDGKVHIVADLKGLKPGDHGFHIHAKGDCSAPDATSAGGHFNPGNTEHGAPDAATHHAGDLGNVTADKDGNAKADMTVDFITLGDGDTDVVGKAVIVHANADDLKSQPTGNAGPRVACGVIEKKEAGAGDEGGAAPADKGAADPAGADKGGADKAGKGGW